MARHKILTFTVMYFIQAWILGLDSKMVSLPLYDPKSSMSLDMAPDSVDDSYKGCEDKMFRKVLDLYLPKERQKNKDFNQAWTAAEDHYKEKGKLSKYYSLAYIQVYVNATANVYRSFNNATRTQKENYTTTFQYHSLHFLLTNALRILNNNFWKRFIKKHFHTFRGTNVTFHHDGKTTMRFGQFTLSSLDKRIAKGFGTKSCFEIATYFGAPLGKYSQLPHEKEVLIPPYEVFKITKVMKRTDKKDFWCDVVYKLQRTKKGKSDLNCHMVKRIKSNQQHKFSAFNQI
ncbi:erythroblast NAD(P)(+)--arginine ADP-ribosyltransferase-like [Salvelinus fontinalis]|uniref:erythroblast NAD(P)(+)--arginine ADP-ribosyltransferase-like n=1 Tax=Salvelinus fontinalis TaxID=8038 RepID=UPI002485DB53|nr:erythroblast NAD(P)(+)--arginine ADP-ribosyltransferase-like [Salvelinus fontinalis]